MTVIIVCGILSTDLDPCVPTTPCQNGGTCTTTEPGQFECQCVEGYEGDSCELMVTNECEPNPCQNGGTCTVRLYYTCCISGFIYTNIIHRITSKTLSVSVWRDTREIVVGMKQTSVTLAPVRMEEHAL